MIFFILIKSNLSFFMFYDSSLVFNSQVKLTCHKINHRKVSHLIFIQGVMQSLLSSSKTFLSLYNKICTN